MSFFLFTKSENRRVEQVLPIPVEGEKKWGKGMGG
jgi:hypothetical protein